MLEQDAVFVGAILAIARSDRSTPHGISRARLCGCCTLSTAMLEPNPDVLHRFGVEVIALLGGRLNQHWLVDRRGESLVLRRWSAAPNDLEYEAKLLERVAALGWPVAPMVERWADGMGRDWSLSAFLSGEPAADKNRPVEQRRRGRLLAEFHLSLATTPDLGQRESWRRGEEILRDATLEPLLIAFEHTDADEARVLLWHLERARELIAPLEAVGRAGIAVHGDFAPWNLLFKDGLLTGILDFELARSDHRIADFALAWRGRYDEVIHAYNEVSLLEADEWALLTPLWWAQLIEGACRNIRAGVRDDGWTLKMLLRRSRLMGDASSAYG